MQLTRVPSARPLGNEDDLVHNVLQAGYLPQAAAALRTAVHNEEGEVRLVFECANAAEFVGVNARLARAGLADLRQDLQDRPGGFDAAFRPASRDEQATARSPTLARA